MKRFLLPLLLAISALAAADGPVRIPVRHADPWVVKAFLEGIAIRSPEASTIPGFAGFGQAVANAPGTFLKDGYLVVNPTDNSLWYFPNRKSLGG